MTKETWKPILGYEGFYEASSLGRIRSLDRYSGAIYATGKRRFYRGRIIRPHLSTTGYLQFAVTKGEKVRRKKVHRVVCEAFHGPAPYGAEARHLDGNRAHNVPFNLAWGTRKENMADAARHGTILRGERRPNTLLTEAKVREIRLRKLAGETYATLASEFGVSASCIQGVRDRRLWMHVE